MECRSPNRGDIPCVPMSCRFWKANCLASAYGRPSPGAVEAAYRFGYSLKLHWQHRHWTCNRPPAFRSTEAVPAPNPQARFEALYPVGFFDNQSFYLAWARKNRNVREHSWRLQCNCLSIERTAARSERIASLYRVLRFTDDWNRPTSFIGNNAIS